MKKPYQIFEELGKLDSAFGFIESLLHAMNNSIQGISKILLENNLNTQFNFVNFNVLEREFLERLKDEIHYKKMKILKEYKAKILLDEYIKDMEDKSD